MPPLSLTVQPHRYSSVASQTTEQVQGFETPEQLGDLLADLIQNGDMWSAWAREPSAIGRTSTRPAGGRAGGVGGEEGGLVIFVGCRHPIVFEVAVSNLL